MKKLLALMLMLSLCLTSFTSIPFNGISAAEEAVADDTVFSETVSAETEPSTLAIQPCLIFIVPITQSRDSKGTACVNFSIASTSVAIDSIGMYSESGTLIKTYDSSYCSSNGSSYSWDMPYSFTNDGKRTFTFKLYDDSGDVITTMTCPVTLEGLRVHSASFSKNSIAAKTKVTATVKTNLGVQYLGMFTESGTLAKKWPASSYSKVSGNTRIWTVSYTFNNAGSRKLTFKGSANGTNFTSAGGAKAGITVTSSTSKPSVTSASFASDSTTTGTKVKITVKTDSSAKYLHMYSESGALVKKWAASGNSSVSGSTRTWTVYHAFSGTGTRTITFKASVDGTNVGTGKKDTIVVKKAAAKPAVTSASFASDSAGVGSKVKITVKTDSSAKYLHMYSESGALVKKWAASGNSSVSGSTRTWTVYHTFSGTGTRTITFKASVDGTNVGAGKKDTIVIKNAAKLYSVKFAVDSAAVNSYVGITAQVSPDTKYLYMYSETGEHVRTWTVDDLVGSDVTENADIWFVNCKFTVPGDRKLTFRASADGKILSNSKSDTVTITNGSAPDVIDAVPYYDDSSVFANYNGRAYWVHTDASAQYLHMISEDGAIVKTWDAATYSSVRYENGNRRWEVYYIFSQAGDRKVTFYASNENGRGAGVSDYFKVHPTTKLTLNKSLTVTVDEDEYKYFVFTTATSGTYYIDENSNFWVYGWLWKLDSNKCTDEVWSLMPYGDDGFEAKAGDVFLLELGPEFGEPGGTATIKLHK